MFISRRVRVAISFNDGRGEGRCEGPAADGACPRVANGGRTACAGGQILALSGTLSDGTRILVGRDSTRCPLEDVVRVAPAPWD